MSAQASIQALLTLRTALERVGQIVPLLAPLQGELIAAIRKNLEDPRIPLVRAKLVELFNEEVVATSAGAKQTMEQIAHSIRPSLNGMLDVARKTYHEADSDIQLLVEEYRQTFEMPNLRLLYSAKRGFYLSLGAGSSMMSERPTLPRVFLQVSKQRGKLSFSSEELISLNNKHRESFNEIVLLTNRILEESAQEIRKELGLLYQAVDSLSLLDLLLSLVGYALSTDKAVQPEIVEWGPLAFRQSRHPILDKLLPQGQTIPNDVFAGEGANFLLLTGANMSGKSTCK